MLPVLVSSSIFSFLNSIEEFCSKVKSGVRRNALTVDDRLNYRNCESVRMVTPEPTVKHGFVMRCHSFQGASEKISTCEKRERAIQEVDY
jgi:hypothetical protein